MQKHTHFDLLLHTDEELGELLGSPVNQRATLHEWPLSCVQDLRLADGQEWIYKAEAAPTVEPEFYAAARSAVLPHTRLLHRDEDSAILLIEKVRGNRLDCLSLSEKDALRTAAEMLRRIAAVQGNPPVYLDISNLPHWSGLMSGMVEDLYGLVSTRRFSKTTRADIRRLASAARALVVEEIYNPFRYRGEIGLVHHDLTCDNIFLTFGGSRIIDWQRPIRGPVDIDRVHLLASLGFDPRPHVHPGIIVMTDLLRVHWLVECSRTWFPAGIPTYDTAIAEIARRIPCGD
jgi:hypothetical protein